MNVTQSRHRGRASLTSTNPNMITVEDRAVSRPVSWDHCRTIIPHSHSVAVSLVPCVYSDNTIHPFFVRSHSVCVMQNSDAVAVVSDVSVVYHTVPSLTV